MYNRVLIKSQHLQPFAITVTRFNICVFGSYPIRCELPNVSLKSRQKYAYFNSLEVTDVQYSTLFPLHIKRVSFQDPMPAWSC